MDCLNNGEKMNVEINVPSIRSQLDYIFEVETEKSIKVLKNNLLAPKLICSLSIDESQYPSLHLLRENEGWEAPPAELVRAYFKQFQLQFYEYNTDAKLAALLGLTSKWQDRRIRAFKEGSKKVPYGLWRKFLVMTGRVPQEIIPVVAFFY